MCKACQACSEQSIEFVCGTCYLEPYQTKTIFLSSLDKYDQFFYVIGNPFHRLEIVNYIENLTALISQTE